MIRPGNAARMGAGAMMLAFAGACSGTGGLGSILGSVLNGGGGANSSNAQVSGTVRGIDTRNQQIAIQQQNGQTVTIAYDQNTQVVYQNQSYQVANLENGDQVTLRIQQLQNGGYYTDMVQVDQSVRGSGNVSSQGNTVSLEGTVRGIDQRQGLFGVSLRDGRILTVSLPNQLSRADAQRYQSLRNGAYVRFSAVYLNNDRVELRQFY